MKGVDISSWQRGLSSLPVDFAIFKISEGRTWSDPCFDEFYELAKREGVPVGAYVFSYATTEDIAREEANNALSLLRGRELPLGIYIDVESAEMLALSDSKLTAVVKAFCDTIRDAGYIAGAYGSSGQLWAKVGPSYVGNIIVWAASWGAKPSISCDLWQYTDNERISGYNGPVDGDEALSERFKGLITGNNEEKPAPPAEDGKDTFTLPEVPVLRKGDIGDAVKAMQGELLALGYSCGGKRFLCGHETADGIFGNVTEESVRSFQRSRNLQDTGVADRTTRAALLGV